MYPSKVVKDRISKPYVSTAGELAYICTTLAEELAHKLCGYDWSELELDQLLTVRAALQLAADEFRDRMIGTFNAAKREKNGDFLSYPAWAQAQAEPAEIDTTMLAATLEAIDQQVRDLPPIEKPDLMADLQHSLERARHDRNEAAS